MKHIANFIDATCLKTYEETKISRLENDAIVESNLLDAVCFNCKCLMIRPEHVAMAKKYITKRKSKVLIGTVIDFPEGTASTHEKLLQAKEAIANGADELDFVADFQAFKKGDRTTVQQQIQECTALCLQNQKTVKWIIETAALSNTEIVQITTLIKHTVIRYFKEADYTRVFIKSSTGFFKTKNNIPNGATPESIMLMLENAMPLSVKASGGIKTFQEALFYLQLGVKRIGSSSFKEIVLQNK